MAVAVWERYKAARYDFYWWRYALSIPKKLLLAFSFACIVGLLAQAKIYLPWTPVPITGQTFGVLLGGILLGGWWGGISMAIYAALGTAGLPWFSGWSSGIPVGPAGLASGGYIIGFIFAAFLVGHFSEKYIGARRFFPMFALMLVANFIIIYAFGLPQLYLYLVSNGQTVGFAQLLAMGFTPFIAGDVTKIVVAAAITRAITPKKAYNGEVDKARRINWRVP